MQSTQYEDKIKMLEEKCTKYKNKFTEEQEKHKCRN